jgi:ABC-type molybdate transport system permease subunit
VDDGEKDFSAKRSSMSSVMQPLVIPLTVLGYYLLTLLEDRAL